MKKATSEPRAPRNPYAAKIAKQGAQLIHQGPSATTLAELPEIDFRKVRLSRNPFAARIAQEGVELAHEAPSPASLAEIPEADFTRLRLHLSQYAAARAERGMKAGRGRPRRGQETEPAPARSVRLPERIWSELGAEAERQGTTVHGLVRQAIVELLELRAYLDTVRAFSGALEHRWRGVPRALTQRLVDDLSASAAPNVIDLSVRAREELEVTRRKQLALQLARKAS